MNVRVGNDYIVCLQTAYGIIDSLLVSHTVAAVLLQPERVDNAFDGRGNYALGIKEQLIFPEIEYDKVDKVRGMDIIFVTTANTDEEARELLTLFNMPFAK